MNVARPPYRFSTHSLTDTAIALVCFGLIMVAMVLHAVAKLITIVFYSHVIQFFSFVLFPTHTHTSASGSCYSTTAQLHML